VVVGRGHQPQLGVLVDADRATFARDRADIECIVGNRDFARLDGDGGQRADQGRLVVEAQSRLVGVAAGDNDLPAAA
jgi:hypothetical protein